MNFNFLFKKTTLTRTLFFVFADIFCIVLSVWLAFLLRFDGSIPEKYLPFVFRMILLAIIFIIPIFYFNKLYSFSWSYVSANEAISLFKATTISFLFLGIAIYISKYFPRFFDFPRSTIFISYALVLIFCSALRLAKRIYLYILGANRMAKKERTLIVGAGDVGEQILRSILSSSAASYWPVGFVDDNPIKKGVMIHGLKVFGPIESIPRVVKEQGVKQMIIALPSAGSKTIKKAIELGKKAGVRKIKIAPALSEIIRGQISFKNLKDVGAEDLLGREEVILNTRQIEDFIKNKTVLVTGAAGSIGSELCRQIANFGPKSILLLDQDETGIFNISSELKEGFPHLEIKSLVADVLDQEKIKKVFEKFRPKIIFHAAAYKHVPLMEEQPDEALKNNVFGTKILAEASLVAGVEKFIFISTDKAVNPTSVMGATKRMGEMICQALNQQNKTKFISVRFGNVLNSRGSVIPIFKEQIKRGGPVEVTHPEMKRYFMLTSEACLLVMQAGAMGSGGEVFILDMGKPIKILDLAKEMIKLSGLESDKDIAIVYSGIRPGEKLFEEMLAAEEGTVVTKNQKIFKAKLCDINSAALEKSIKELADTLRGQLNKEAIMKIVRALDSNQK